MATLLSLDPHDPVPETGRFILVLQRFGEDDPQVRVVEFIESDGVHARSRLALAPDRRPLGFAEATEAALARALNEAIDTVYALDRTAGPREQIVRSHHGDHTVAMEGLADSDAEDEEPGTDIRDRPHDAGFTR